MTKVMALSLIDYSKIDFESPIKASDGRYFMKCFYKEEDENSDSTDILVQVNNVVAQEELSKNLLRVATKYVSTQSNTISEVDDNFLVLAKQNKDLWFPGDDEITDSYLESAFMNTLKPIKKTHDAEFKLILNKDAKIYDTDKSQVGPEQIVVGKSLSMICTISGLWFTKTRFGITWKINQLKVKSNPSLIKECLIEDDEPEDIEDYFPY
jgi:hypothetical protein